MKNWLIWKDPDAGKDWRHEEKGLTEDEMVGWHHWLNGHEFEQTLGVGDGQGCLACCSPWVHKESDTTEPLNYTHLSLVIFVKFFLLYKISIKLKTEKIIKPIYHQPPSCPRSNTLSLFHLCHPHAPHPATPKVILKQVQDVMLFYPWHFRIYFWKIRTQNLNHDSIIKS